MPIYFGADEVSLPGIGAVYYGEELVYSAGGGIDYLRITANTAGSTVALTTVDRSPDIEYSLDGGDVWTTWDYSTITLPDVGSYVLFRGDNPDGFSTSYENYAKFSITGSAAVSGNIMTLIDGVGSTRTIPSDCCFYMLFYQCPITSAPDLPATVLMSYCYMHMLAGTDIIVTPELPAPSLVRGCYLWMFRSCEYLTDVSPIHATTLDRESCQGMFYISRSLSVTDTPGEGATAFFTCPSTTGLYRPVSAMFAETAGPYTSPPVDGATYYYL